MSNWIELDSLRLVKKVEATIMSDENSDSE